MILYIGIDDTDSRVKSRKKMGTGRVAREIAKLLSQQLRIKILCVTRHQLLKEVTGEKTNNSSKCIIAEINNENDLPRIRDLVVNAVKNLAHHESNAGVAFFYGTPCQEALDLAYKIKTEKINKATVYEVAKHCGIQLFEVNGDGSGIIGAFAAVILASTGNDGRILDKGKIREISGLVPVFELLKLGVDEIRCVDSNELVSDGVVVVDKMKPVFRNFKAVLYVRRVDNVWKPVVVD